MSKIRTLAYMLATSLAMAEHMNKGNVYEDEDTDVQRLPKITCKDCSFYTGGTFCKQVKHHVNKQTPANQCGHFKN